MLLSRPLELAMQVVSSCLGGVMVFCERLWLVFHDCSYTNYHRNPGGIRFGSAEIYDAIEACFSPSQTSDPAHTIIDYLAVGQAIDEGNDERVILFIQLIQGETLSAELEKKIKAEVRTRRSPRHVPSKVICKLQRYPTTFLMKPLIQIIQVQDIPYTLNGKRVEVPVKKVSIAFRLACNVPRTFRSIRL